MNTIEYSLQRSFKYSFEGNSNNQAKSVTLHEPDYSNPEYFMEIQDIISTAQISMFAKFEKLIPEQEEEISGEEIKPLHKTDLKKDLEKIEKATSDSIKGGGKSKELITIFKRMVKNSKKSIIVVDGKEKMTAHMLNSVWPIDLFRIAIRWASFFVIAPEEQESQSSGMQSDFAERAKVV